MYTQKSQTVFIEYSHWEKGQHSHTVIQIMDGKRIIIGRIYREYSPEEKKVIFRAEDHTGNQIFADINELYALKKKFKEHGKSLAYTVPRMPKGSSQTLRQAFNTKPERQNELKKIRNERTIKDKPKEKENTKANANEKNNEIQKDKEFENIESGRNKDLTEIPDKYNPDEKAEGIEESETINPFQDEQSENDENEIQAEREAELEQIREDNEDREQDMELER